MARPYPPRELLERIGEGLFFAAPDLEVWARETFLDDGAELENEDHRHLQQAKLGFLWTNVSNSRQMKTVIGTAELAKPASGSKWQRARIAQQVREWFGDEPDFIITVDAHYASQAGDPEFCALIEHELYHCGQDVDAFGAPKFRADGSPAFAMRGHDIEEFVGVVRRYGAQAAGVEALIEAAKGRPEVARADISQACGTCMLRAA